MDKYYSLIIPGCPPGCTVANVLSPYDGTVIAEVEQGGMEHAEAALENAYLLFRNRDSWLTLHRRIEILQQAAEIMRENHEELALQAAKEGGKPLLDSRVEVTRAIEGVHYCIEVLKTEQGEVIPMGMSPSSTHRMALTQKEPIGVVVAVSAFNHPLNLIVHQVAAAVASGCPVIVKPADDTPLSCINFVRTLHQAGLPEEWCQVFIAQDIATAEKLVTDPRVGFFSFIGSANVGWMLRSKLAPGTRCALEHGGAAPLILAEDADMDLALASVLKGGFYHAGQVCVSVQRVFAHRSLAREFARNLADKAAGLKVGDPTLPETEVGPLIRPREVQRVDEWVREAADSGAEILTGGESINEHCYRCTVLFNPPRDARVSTAEIFGPVVCVYEYDDLDIAIEQSNALPFAFQAAVFTRNLDTALKVYKRLDASAVMVNDHTAFRVDNMPFAGLKKSGLGVGGIRYTMEDMQVNKMLIINSPDL